MLSIAQVSGLIAAAVMVVQYALPAALVIILIKFVGTENTAATWSTVNRTISNTIWPLILRADSVGAVHRSFATVVLTWTMTFAALLLVVTSVVAPLGLYEEVIPGSPQPVLFQYARDPSPWSAVTMPRPNLKFSRHCEVGLAINCPGQYQGVYMNETRPGVFSSVETDENSTINTTVPANYTAMFTSATGPDNTLSGLFDIQYRRWLIDFQNIIDKGEPHVEGDARRIESLIPQDDILLREGLVIDMRDNGGIGFRNHTVPAGLTHGGTWSEDLTWLQAVTECVDTNLTIEARSEASKDSFISNETYFVVDRGAFQGLDISSLQAPPWSDNQTLDLFGRAHKAAQMYNFLLGTSLNLSLPLDPATERVPIIAMEDVNITSFDLSPDLFPSFDKDEVRICKLDGLEGFPNTSIPIVPLPDDFVPSFPDGKRRLFASNFTAITQICRGYYTVNSLDLRANNITNPAVECGLVLGPWTRLESDVPEHIFTAVKKKQRNIHVCATGIRSSIKTVHFRFNGTGEQLSNLQVERISDKAYPNDAAKPLWAVEHSFDRRMRFDALWGLVNDSYETYEGFYTTRSEHLWLPAGPYIGANAFSLAGVGLGSVPAPSVPYIKIMKAYEIDLDSAYSGDISYPMIERFRRLSQSQSSAGHIPSLIIHDELAAALVGSKSAIRSEPITFPAMMTTNDPPQAFANSEVAVYKRVIRYDLRYAIPAFATLALFLLVMLWAASILLFSWSTLPTLKHIYNQTSAGRLATSLLLPGRTDPQQSSTEWAEGDGKLVIGFGRVRGEGNYFCRLQGHDGLLDEKGRESPRLEGHQ
ncbi:hypothetical protein OQA88_10539 [Cercophora sp. LCS_1]